jgi:hypothetical protein
MNAHAVQIISSNSGSFVTGRMSLDGSLDSVHFYQLIGTSEVTDGSLLFVVENMPAQFVRVSFAAYNPTSAAGAATVTALVVAQD